MQRCVHCANSSQFSADLLLCPIQFQWNLGFPVATGVTRTCFVDLQVLMSDFSVLMHGASNVLFWSIFPVFSCECWSVVRDLCKLCIQYSRLQKSCNKASCRVETTIDLPRMNLIIFPASASPTSLFKHNCGFPLFSLFVARLLQSAVSTRSVYTVCTQWLHPIWLL